DEEGATRVRLGGFDIDGVLRGKYISMDKFRSALTGGLGFCDVIFGWDSQDELYEDVGITLTGWHSGYPDLTATIDPATERRVPWDRNIPFFLLDFALQDGSPYPASPRQVLKGVVARAAEAGFSARFAGEFEFFIFNEDSETVREKGYRDMTPLSPGMFGYSALRASTFSDMLHDLVESLDEFDVPVEGIHTETGPGVYEAAIGVDEVIAAADKAALFKTATKELLVRHGVMATFMAKISNDLPGCSGHSHQSLWRDGEPAFHDASDPDGMSATFRSYLAGLQALLPDLMAMYCPTVNSYKRTVPGAWAPTTATWGFENRTAALRVIRSGTGKATRVENRLVGSDMNPYLAFAASLAAGLWGIEQGLELGAPVEGNAYDPDPDAIILPRTLEEAADRMEASEAARAILGDTFVDHYVGTRRWEVKEARKAITDWELARYFEII
ncbi:MAG: glutamine synthetase family protein, partial [Myxococcota bacterium]|nr:glutamine synthetase family protein [Myxococcota bacterium]